MPVYVCTTSGVASLSRVRAGSPSALERRGEARGGGGEAAGLYSRGRHSRVAASARGGRVGLGTRVSQTSALGDSLGLFVLSSSDGGLSKEVSRARHTCVFPSVSLTMTL